jgi:general secretion pathway protein G
VRPRVPGFTLIEMLVVLAIVATLLMLATPRYMHSVERGREAVLREDLRVMREAIDRFQADQGRYPGTLDELVDRRYIRHLPPDPITESVGSWILVPPPQGSGVYDVRSGAAGQALDGTAYDTW